jgi:signal transduction histidine kinase
MHWRTWPVAALALTGVLVLVAVSVLASSRRAREIFRQIDDINAHHQQIETKLRSLRSDVNLSGILVRDYLLDTSEPAAYRTRLAQLRTANKATALELRHMISPGASGRMGRLQTTLDEYWQTFDPLFGWTPAEKLTRSAVFLRNQVIPRREAVLTIALEIEELNNDNLEKQRAQVAARERAFQDDLIRMLWRSLLLGVVVALTAVVRLRVLERRTDDQREQALDAERQMRSLSQQLVAAQEEERKKLSRELHDQVGQMLTALRMELGRVDRLTAGDAAARSVAESRQLVDTMLRSVRDLALGLRPSMLDDFGLQPALEWHVRDLARRHGVHVDLQIAGEVSHLSERYRTCVYRVIQEALTNSVRHARPDRISVSVNATGHELAVLVADDGIGLDPARRGVGLGLLGIEERVRELGGTTLIRSAEGGGTSIRIRLPLFERAEENPVASAAG